jgi:serine/threonine-protein kinase SRPK3
MRRFQRIHDIVESVEKYREGGYHPTSLGDILSHRYRVLAKLGYGQSSTVWMAFDEK